MTSMQTAPTLAPAKCAAREAWLRGLLSSLTPVSYLPLPLQHFHAACSSAVYAPIPNADAAMYSLIGGGNLSVCCHVLLVAASHFNQPSLPRRCRDCHCTRLLWQVKGSFSVSFSFSPVVINKAGLP